MSIVGPRPLLPEYNSRYTEIQAKRLYVKPGLTGLAQISGRNELLDKKSNLMSNMLIRNRFGWISRSYFKLP